MGIQELLIGVGILVLLAALIYGVTRAGRQRQSETSKVATRQMYNDNRDT